MYDRRLWREADVMFEIQKAVKARDHERIEKWQAAHEMLLEANAVDPGFEHVGYVCVQCGTIYIDLDRPEVNAELCPSCQIDVDEMHESFDDYDEVAELDPNRNYNAWASRRDAGSTNCEAFERIDREADRYYDGGDYDPNAKRDRHTPCDEGECPYDAAGGYDCRNYCGLGVDEDSPDYKVDEDDDDYYDNDGSDDYSQNAPCDNSGYCAGMSCPNYFQCFA